MKKIIIFFIICIYSFGFWLTSEKAKDLEGTEKEIALFNFNGDSSWILIDKVEEYVPIYSENGKRILGKPEKSYYEITINFEEFLGERKISELKPIKITNEKNNELKNLKVEVFPKELIIKSSIENEPNNFISFLKDSKYITLFFRDNNEKLAVQKFNVEGFAESEKVIVSKKEDLSSTNEIEISHKIYSEEEYMEKFVEIYDGNILESNDKLKIFFKIKNNGNKNLDEVTVNLKILDVNQNITLETDLYSVYKDGLFGKLNARSEYSLKLNDYFYIDIPKSWTGKYILEIKKIKFDEE